MLENCQEGRGAVVIVINTATDYFVDNLPEFKKKYLNLFEMENRPLYYGLKVSIPIHSNGLAT